MSIKYTDSSATQVKTRNKIQAYPLLVHTVLLKPSEKNVTIDHTGIFRQ